MRWGWIFFWTAVFIVVAPVAAANIVHAIGPALSHVAAGFTTFITSFR